MTKYYWVTLKTLYDGFEFYSSSVHKVENEVGILELAKGLAKDHYNDCENAEEFDNGETDYCEFNDGTFLVSISSEKEIPKEDYDVLEKYF